MLGSDGLTLLEPHATMYASFLASQIGDLIAYFDARARRATGIVTLAEPGQTPLNRTPPQLNWGTPNTSGLSWANASGHSTPRDSSDVPQSGVLMLGSL